jgi:hypothetical protein
MSRKVLDCGVNFHLRLSGFYLCDKVGNLIGQEVKSGVDWLWRTKLSGGRAEA